MWEKLSILEYTPFPRETRSRSCTCAHMPEETDMWPLATSDKLTDFIAGLGYQLSPSQQRDVTSVLMALSHQRCVASGNIVTQRPDRFIALPSPSWPPGAMVAGAQGHRAAICTNLSFAWGWPISKPVMLLAHQMYLSGVFFVVNAFLILLMVKAFAVSKWFALGRRSGSSCTN